VSGKTERSKKIVKPVRGGQVTIPVEFRQKLGIDADTLLEISLEGGEIHIRPLTVAPRVAGSPWLKELYDYFAPVRAEAEEKGYSDEEINAAIDEAVRDVRSRHG
jgi:AbrB family looped-hinge helix DNA binding protein